MRHFHRGSRAAAHELSWRARPAIAAGVHVTVALLPIVATVIAVYALSRLVALPRGSLVLQVCWWAALSATASVVLAAAGRLSRRLLPLAALMRLSLVFPDGAPSRFRVARRWGTVATLEERLAEARSGKAGETPAEAAERLLVLVAWLDLHDPLTRGHSERVRVYAQSIGRELGLDQEALDLLNWAALLHDVGKLDVPHEILAKSGRPTDAEWRILREHPAAGARLAAPLRAWLGEWSAAIEEHHERWDGAGYPHGRAGTEISLAGRIVAVADVFDVITSSRTYKQPRSAVEGRQEISRCAGTQFDPDVVRAFLAISVRQGRLAAPLPWLANAAMLIRLPVSQATSGLSAGAAAAVAVGVGAGVGVSGLPPAPIEAASQVQALATRPVGPRPAVRLSGSKAGPAPATRRRRPSHRSLRAPSTPPPPPAQRRSGPEPTVAPRTVAPSVPPRPRGRAVASAPSGTAPHPLPEQHVDPSRPPLLPLPASAPRVPTNPDVPSVAEGVTSLTDGVSSLTETVSKLPIVASLPVVPDVANDVSTLTGDVPLLTADGSTLADGVSTLTSGVTALLTPPPPPTSKSPPSPPASTSAPPAPAPSLADGLLSALHGP